MMLTKAVNQVDMLNLTQTDINYIFLQYGLLGWGRINPKEMRAIVPALTLQQIFILQEKTLNFLLSHIKTTFGNSRRENREFTNRKHSGWNFQKYLVMWQQETRFWRRVPQLPEGFWQDPNCRVAANKGCPVVQWKLWVTGMSQQRHNSARRCLRQL